MTLGHQERRGSTTERWLTFEVHKPRKLDSSLHKVPLKNKPGIGLGAAQQLRRGRQDAEKARRQNCSSGAIERPPVQSSGKCVC